MSQTATVTFDDESMSCRRPGGFVEVVKWSDLHTVLVQTTDAGPAVDDLFWVLVGSESGCVVPSESEGIDLLLERLQRLSNFDYEPLIRAMSCTENREFICWQRQESKTRSSSQTAADTAIHEPLP